MKKMPLTKGLFALVDDEDYEAISRYKWSVSGDGKYAVRNSRKEGMIYMHRFVMGFPAGSVDHKNRNGLDNRRHNLRLASQAENNANRGVNRNNTSGFTGVHWEKDRKKWRAAISKGGKHFRIGSFTTKKAAARAYADALVAIYGDFALGR
jgi:hypothetical protein